MSNETSGIDRENVFTEDDWDDILYRISKGNCTPFLGAGVNYSILPLGSELADALAKEFSYPFDDCSDLAKVAQFVAINRDPIRAKETVLDILKEELEQPQKQKLLKDPNHPLNILADLPLPIYITTNYDDLMFKVLKDRTKSPRRDFCRWDEELRKQQPILSSEFDPEPAIPLVFHLHGCDEWQESLVLTEDDYVDFLVNFSRDKDIMLPPRIQAAMTRASLLFLGYGLTDWDFRVIFRGLFRSMAKGLQYNNLAVQLDPEDEVRRNYLNKYFRELKIKVYWGTAHKFAAELKEQWEGYSRK